MSRKPRRSFSREFKLNLCRQLASGETRIVHVCRQHDICRSVIERWRDEYQAKGEQAFNGSPSDQEDTVASRQLRAAGNPRAGRCAADRGDRADRPRPAGLWLSSGDRGAARQGWRVNHKRVQRLMSAAGLGCRRRRRQVATTDSRHGLPVWPNLLPKAAAERPNQVWVADITYIRLPVGFCYLAAVLDACSRLVVGWELSSQLDASLPLAALDQALSRRRPEPGWLHHSDRGSQYASRDYIGVLQRAQATISMSQRGHPRDNARMESFFRNLKVEEVYVQEYRDLDEAEANLARFIDEVYNQKRLHSSLGYVPPGEFEARFECTLGGCRVSE